MFSLICVWINGWVNNCEAGDLRSHRGHYDAIAETDIKTTNQGLVMLIKKSLWWPALGQAEGNVEISVFSGIITDSRHLIKLEELIRLLRYMM